MKRIMIAGLLTAVAATAACDRKAERQAPGPAVKVRSEAQDRLHKLSEMDRAIGLKRAIYGTGATCARVTETRFVGQYKNMDMWAVRCADKRDWALFVGADDSVQVRLCKDTEAVGLPSCKLGGPAQG